MPAEHAQCLVLVMGGEDDPVTPIMPLSPAAQTLLAP